MKRTILIITFLLTANLVGQTNSTGKVFGNVFDETNNKPLEFVNIALVSLPDSSVMKGTTTDKKGNYKINNVSKGNYFLRYRFIGYEQKESKHFLIDA